MSLIGAGDQLNRLLNAKSGSICLKVHAPSLCSQFMRCSNMSLIKFADLLCPSKNPSPLLKLMLETARPQKAKVFCPLMTCVVPWWHKASRYLALTVIVLFLYIEPEVSIQFVISWKNVRTESRILEEHGCRSVWALVTVDVRHL